MSVLSQPPWARLLKPVALLALLGLLALQIRGLAQAEGPLAERVASFGAMDFVAFWAGAQVFVQGGDPYTFEQVLAVQEAAGLDDQLPFLNPPWTLTLLAPLGLLPFQVARWTWMALNLLFLTGSALLIRRWTGASERLEPVFLVGAFTFVPAIMTFQYGQMSLLILFGLSAALAALRARRDLLAGLALTLCTLKPHLLLPLFLAGTILVVRERRWGVAAGAAIGLAALLAPTVHLLPRFAAMDFSPLILKTSALASGFRAALLALTGTLPTWPIGLITGLGLLGTGLWALRTRFEPEFDGNVVGLIAVSLIAAPYAWFWDYVLLLPMQLLMFGWLAQRIERREKVVLAALVLLPQVLIVPVALTSTDFSVFFWVPLALMSVWVWGRRRGHHLRQRRNDWHAPPSAHHTAAHPRTHSSPR